MVASRLQVKPLWSRRTIGSLLQKREVKRVNGFFRAALLTSLSCSEPTDPLDEVENVSMNWIMSGLHMARMSRGTCTVFTSGKSKPTTSTESGASPLGGFAAAWRAHVSAQVAPPTPSTPSISATSTIA
jgi:hypothetical protein